MGIRPRILYENRLNDAAPIASSTDAGGDPPFNVLNLRDFRPFTLWKPAAMPADILLNSGGAMNADYLAVSAHDLGTQGATIELQGSNDNFATAGVSIATVTPADDEPFAVFYAGVTYSDWKIILTGATAPTMGIVAFGEMLEIPRGLPQGFDPIGRTPVGKFNRSESGAPLGSIIEFEKYEATLEFPYLTWTWMRASWLPAWNAHLRGSPYLYLWNYQDYPAEMYLLKTAGGFKGPQNSGQISMLSFNVVATI